MWISRHNILHTHQHVNIILHSRTSGVSKVSLSSITEINNHCFTNGTVGVWKLGVLANGSVCVESKFLWLSCYVHRRSHSGLTTFVCRVVDHIALSSSNRIVVVVISDRHGILWAKSSLILVIRFAAQLINRPIKAVQSANHTAISHHSFDQYALLIRAFVATKFSLSHAPMVIPVISCALWTLLSAILWGLHGRDQLLLGLVWELGARLASMVKPCCQLRKVLSFARTHVQRLVLQLLVLVQFQSR